VKFDKIDRIYKPEPKKIGFIFTTKITKEKKNKLYNLRALRVLRGVIKLFFVTKCTKFTTKQLKFIYNYCNFLLFKNPVYPVNPVKKTW